MAKSRLMFLSTLHDTTAVLIPTTTAAPQQGLTPRAAIHMLTLCPTINLAPPEANLLHILKSRHVLLWDPAQFLGNNHHIAPVLVRSNGIYPPSHLASTNMSHDAFVHTVTSYPIIIVLRNACKVARMCTVGETRTLTTSPRRPTRLTILLLALPTDSLLFHQMVLRYSPEPRVAGGPVLTTRPAGGRRL